MSNTKPVPIKKDIVGQRRRRQTENNDGAYKGLIQGKLDMKYINNEELTRTFKDYEENHNTTRDKILGKCKTDPLFAVVFARNVSKNGSRQGSLDEKTQIDTCQETTQKCGVNIINLPAAGKNSVRPSKNSRECLIGIKKDTRTNLKSFDAKITGKVDGYACNKVTAGDGGHQDNVDDELVEICKWVKNYHNADGKLWIIIWDTDLTTKFNTLKKDYLDVPNLIIVNHVEYQQYILDNYWEEEST